MDGIKEHQWKPGQSGNPAGRPKGQHLAEVLSAVLAERTGPKGKHDPDGRTKLHQMVEAAVNQAILGDSSFFRLIVEHTFGRALPKPVETAGTTTAADLVRSLEAAADRYERPDIGSDRGGTGEVSDGPGPVQCDGAGS